ncbi:hypothetical protein [Bacillus thuringiensis]|uniref:Uncharacterized protein n=3 Tax=Bacillaceae TaxID=186817 RepID=A0AAP4V3Z5_BACTU|nr:hypothetical protein [Bacillus thuringiensis]AFV21443.1 hypothetical protein BTB_502p01070 [Bacillus thuringiensis Bt407]ERI01381.1 hypothetical protein BTCBT_002969 [Bacillus thuringiensis T01-328]MEC3052860.1 hypothetical protein [Bacillus cereus]PQZ78188.1 hypothetical protein CQ064_10275 [Bacillus sp. MYb78]HDR7922168.1 hypothetical protein [Bacillus paranthracis]
MMISAEMGSIFGKNKFVIKGKNECYVSKVIRERHDGAMDWEGNVIRKSEYIVILIPKSKIQKLEKREMYQRPYRFRRSGFQIVDRGLYIELSGFFEELLTTTFVLHYLRMDGYIKFVKKNYPDKAGEYPMFLDAHTPYQVTYNVFSVLASGIYKLFHWNKKNKKQGNNGGDTTC